jgi:hypothetical protein
MTSLGHHLFGKNIMSMENCQGVLKRDTFGGGIFLKLLDKFKGMARVEIKKNGQSCFFWDDLWGSEILSQKFPVLFSYTRKKKITFAEGVAHTPVHSLFHLPLSQQAHMQLIQLQVILDGFPVNDASDIWSYIWNSNLFLVKRTYKHLSGQLTPHPAFRWLWSCSCQSKHKFFFWLLLKDRLSTRELLKRKNMPCKITIVYSAMQMSKNP